MRNFIKLEIKYVILLYIFLVVSEFTKVLNKDLGFIKYKGKSIISLLSSSLLESNSAVGFYYYCFTFFYIASLLRIAVSIFIFNASNGILTIYISRRGSFFSTLILRVLIYFSIAWIVKIGFPSILRSNYNILNTVEYSTIIIRLMYIYRLNTI